MMPVLIYDVDLVLVLTLHCYDCYQFCVDSKTALWQCEYWEVTDTNWTDDKHYRTLLPVTVKWSRWLIHCRQPKHFQCCEFTWIQINSSKKFDNLYKHFNTIPTLNSPSEIPYQYCTSAYWQVIKIHKNYCISSFDEASYWDGRFAVLYMN